MDTNYVDLYVQHPRLEFRSMSFLPTAAASSHVHEMLNMSCLCRISICSLSPGAGSGVDPRGAGGWSGRSGGSRSLAPAPYPGAERAPKNCVQRECKLWATAAVIFDVGLATRLSCRVSLMCRCRVAYAQRLSSRKRNIETRRHVS